MPKGSSFKTVCALFCLTIFISMLLFLPSLAQRLIPYASEPTIGVVSVFDGGGVEASAPTISESRIEGLFPDSFHPSRCSFAYLKSNGMCLGNSGIFSCRFREGTKEEKRSYTAVDNLPWDYDPPRNSFDCWGKNHGRPYIPCKFRTCEPYIPDVEP